MGMAGGRTKKRPNKTGFLILKMNKWSSKGKSGINWRGSIKLEDGTNISVTIPTNPEGKVKAVDGKGKQEGKKVIFADTAEFSGDSDY